MGWLRLDDGFLLHPKIVELSDRELRQWLAVLLYCARYRTDGVVTEASARSIGLSRKDAKRYENLRLLDAHDRGFRVHDWRVYNAMTIAEKVAAFLEENPDATANEICRNVGGKREVVLSEIERQRFPGGSLRSSASVPEVVPKPVPERYPPRAGAGAPVPSLKEQEPAAAEVSGGTPRDPVPAAAAAEDLLEQLADNGWDASLLEAASAEPDRARAWLDVALDEAETNVGGYAASGFRTGGYPSPRTRPDNGTADDPHARLLHSLERWVACPEALEYGEASVRDELNTRARKAGVQLSPDDETALVDAWADARRTAAA